MSYFTSFVKGVNIITIIFSQCSYTFSSILSYLEYVLFYTSINACICQHDVQGEWPDTRNLEIGINWAQNPHTWDTGAHKNPLHL